MSAANMCVSGFGKRGAIITEIMKVLTKAKFESCEAVLGVQLWRLYRISIAQQRQKSVKQKSIHGMNSVLRSAVRP